MRPELQPGSAEPSDPAEVDVLLSHVPELAFQAPFDPCLPTVDDPTPSHAEVDRVFAGEGLRPVVDTLEKLATLAAEQNNGGVAFLVRTMLHFIETEAVPASQHPLLVALYLRAHARANGTPDTPPAIAAAMDRWA